jgi:hypothetical protein
MRSMLIIVSALSLTACASRTSVNSLGGFRLHVDESAPVAVDESADSSMVPVTDAAPANAADADDPNANQVDYITVLVGERWLRSGEASDLGVDRPFVAGAEWDSHDTETGHGYELGYQWSDEDGNSGGQSVDFTFQELYAGYRYTMNADDTLQPYLGGGVTFLHGNVDAGPQSGDDDAWGAYFRLGIAMAFDRLRFGLDYRHVFANLHVLGQDVDGDFDQLALTAGFRF